MNLRELNLQNLGLDKIIYGRVLTIVDFGNVTYWYRKDRIGPDAAPLQSDERLIVNLEMLYSFIRDFSFQARFYYGWHPRLPNSQHLVVKADKLGFIKNTKRIQYVKHYLTQNEPLKKIQPVLSNIEGRYIEIPKCNFDVEITIDTIRLMKDYDTLCLFSGDSDFARLAYFLKKRGKKVIVIATGQIYHELKQSADLYINAQRIKSHIVSVKKPRP